MAQSFIQWDSPTIKTLDTTMDVVYFFDDFDAKMQEAGLIKISSESTGYTQPSTAWTSNNSGTYFEVMKLAYKFPKGKNKVEFEDVAGQTYKKIKRASYANTDTEILFKIFFLKATNGSATYPKETYYNDSTILCMELWTRNSSSGQWNKCSVMGSRNTYGSGENLIRGLTHISKTNYIHQTEDSFAIYFGYLNYKQTSDNTFETPNCLVSFILKRHEDDNGHSIIYANDQRPSSPQVQTNQLNMSSCFNNSFKTEKHEDISKNFYNQNYNGEPANINGNIVIYPINSMVRSRELNKLVYTTKYLPDTPVIEDNNLIIEYKGKSVIVGTVTYGFYNNSLTYSQSSTLKYGFVMIKTDYDITTEDLT